jgi:hypothetical protein
MPEVAALYLVLNRKDATERMCFTRFSGSTISGSTAESASYRRDLSRPTVRLMCLFSQTMLRIAIELSASDPMYIEMALKFTEHFL